MKNNIITEPMKVAIVADKMSDTILEGIKIQNKIHSESVMFAMARQERPKKEIYLDGDAYAKTGKAIQEG